MKIPNMQYLKILIGKDFINIGSLEEWSLCLKNFQILINSKDIVFMKLEL